MKVYVILQSYTDYKGSNATSLGVYPTKEGAVKALSNAVIEWFGFESIEEFEENYGKCFEDFMGLGRESWTWDRGDDVIEFYIQEDTLKE